MWMVATGAGGAAAPGAVELLGTARQPARLEVLTALQAATSARPGSACDQMQMRSRILALLRQLLLHAVRSVGGCGQDSCGAVVACCRLLPPGGDVFQLPDIHTVGFQSDSKAAGRYCGAETQRHSLVFDLLRSDVRSAVRSRRPNPRSAAITASQFFSPSMLLLNQVTFLPPALA